MKIKQNVSYKNNNNCCRQNNLVEIKLNKRMLLKEKTLFKTIFLEVIFVNFRAIKFLSIG